MKRYQVIGGQYEKKWYGESDTLIGAKRIATKHEEYWDNYQGWHTPLVYAAKDCKVITCKGWITETDGSTTIIPKCGAIPYSAKVNGKWEDWKHV